MAAATGDEVDSGVAEAAIDRVLTLLAKTSLRASEAAATADTRTAQEGVDLRAGMLGEMMNDIIMRISMTTRETTTREVVLHKVMSRFYTLSFETTTIGDGVTASNNEHSTEAGEDFSWGLFSAYRPRGQDRN